MIKLTCMMYAVLAGQKIGIAYLKYIQMGCRKPADVFQLPFTKDH